MQIRDQEQALSAGGIESKKGVKPMAAGGFAGQAAKTFIFTIGIIEALELAITECRLIHQRQQTSVGRSQRFLFR
jgi:hypothetical protein